MPGGRDHFRTGKLHNQHAGVLVHTECSSYTCELRRPACCRVWTGQRHCLSKHGSCKSYAGKLEHLESGSIKVLRCARVEKNLILWLKVLRLGVLRGT